MNKPLKAPWRLETLRLTTFPTTMPDVSSITWWEEVVGEKPVTKTVQPWAGSLQVAGTIKNRVCNLSLICQPMRVDWLLTPILSDKTELTEFPTFASLNDGIKLFNEILLPWLKVCPPLNRIAFGAVLIYAVKDRKEGYEVLSNYLSTIKLDPEGSKEFSYQINRPRPSRNKVAGLHINRLSRWSVAKLNGMIMQFSIGQEVTSKVFKSDTGLDACRLELDISTSEDYNGELPKDMTNPIYQELLEVGLEIAQRGDVP